jgi:uncharacterized membrane protein YebE (DUF533 family)
MKPMPESKFNMWRSCVAAVHLDGLVSKEERKWVEEKIQKLPVSAEQILILMADLESSGNFEEAFSKITDFLIKIFRGSREQVLISLKQ